MNLFGIMYLSALCLVGLFIIALFITIQVKLKKLK